MNIITQQYNATITLQTICLYVGSEKIGIKSPTNITGTNPPTSIKPIIVIIFHLSQFIERFSIIFSILFVTVVPINKTGNKSANGIDKTKISKKFCTLEQNGILRKLAFCSSVLIISLRAYSTG